jgi:CAAX protease family protein
LAAVVVAFIEELIFRGALFGILRKTLLWPVALVVSSAVYAAVHFLQKADPPGSIHWFSGLALLPHMLGNLTDAGALAPAFFTLLLAGAMLAFAYQKSGTLYLSIGLHAGWIFWLKSYRFITQETPGHAEAFWGSDKLIDGWLAVAVLGCTLLLMLAKARRKW